MEQHPHNFTTQSSKISQLSNKIENVGNNIHFPVRILIAILGVMACILLSSTRYNLSIAIIPMMGDSCTPVTSICAIDDSDNNINEYENQSQSIMTMMDETVTADAVTISIINTGELSSPPPPPLSLSSSSSPSSSLTLNYNVTNSVLSTSSLSTTLSLLTMCDEIDKHQILLLFHL